MSKNKRFFNTAGPIVPEDHYCVNPLQRLELEKILSLIDQKKYFVLHAPRQTGKTSYLLALMDHINHLGKNRCLYVNIEKAQAARENVKTGVDAILQALASSANKYLNDPFLNQNRKRIFEESGELGAIHETLNQWSAISEKPIILLIDEVDSLIGNTLISLLRQLRSGYPERPKLFPQSIVLCGVRDVRDYRIHSQKDKTIITGGSAFNVKAKSLRLGNFNPQEIKELLMQHTEDTGQQLDDDVFPYLWEQTGGQPWLVNALAYEACFEIKEGLDRTKTITLEIFKKAKEALIQRRETHLDQLADKLSEERVRRVIEPILAATMEPKNIPPDDVDYVEDLGLIITSPQLRIANKIYKEIIPRQLTYSTQATIHQESQWYLKDDGRLDMDKLLTAFQSFFRKQFESWVEGFQYKEAGPQLLLQAFLQRIINGGGQVEREYGVGRQRTDLQVIWPYPKGKQEVVLELKIQYGSREKTIQKGLEQTRGYLDKCGTGEGYLLIFNRDENLTWEQKVFKETRTINGTGITVWGM